MPCLLSLGEVGFSVFFVAESCREPQVSPGAVQHVLWRPVSLLVGHPVERMVLTWVSPAGSSQAGLDGVAEHIPALWHSIPLMVSLSHPSVFPSSALHPHLGPHLL